MKTLRKLILAEIYILLQDRLPTLVGQSMKENLVSLSGCFCELDSSSVGKFSRHLIVQMPHNTVFATTMDCGFFVHRITETIDRYIKETSQSTRKLKVRKSEGEFTSIIDESVYAKNHNFRIISSSKYEDLGQRHL